MEYSISTKISAIWLYCVLRLETSKFINRKDISSVHIIEFARANLRSKAEEVYLIDNIYIIDICIIHFLAAKAS